MSEKPLLYMNALSPACRAVLMCAAELGIELDQKIVNLMASEQKKASFIQVSQSQLHHLINLANVFQIFHMIFFFDDAEKSTAYSTNARR